ncbi:membrane integrity lipid transport subunit YebS [Mangrovibacter sp. MFB070]|uniref:membrane integrity lipid transport subunit YebS n=1 Tax=Mangrovibacter sp. MFB070 TaxID=1224318 RepID=UPI000565716E|nr:membrane integrity lipid transport subunit YebS [Mangrovibacter sp. MFB070]
MHLKLRIARLLSLPARSVALPKTSEAHYQRCHECDMLFLLPSLTRRHTAYCPRCNAHVDSGRDWSMKRLTIIAITMLILMPFAWTSPLLSVWLLGARIDASLMQGIWQMVKQGDVITASLVTFCSVGAPATLVASILYLRIAPRIGMNARPVLLMLHRLKEWIMVDIYLIGIVVATIKVRDYAFIQWGEGLVAFIALVVLSILTIIYLNTGQLWQRFYPQPFQKTANPHARVCLACHHTGEPDERGRCSRCHVPLRLRRRHSLQKSWAALVASLMFLIPANLLPISIIYVNGTRQEDTILSGIISLGHGNIFVAAIVFIASILVPFTKVIVLFTLLVSIHCRCEQGILARMKMLRVITWVGRWSMLDLFVISLMMSLVNREQLLAFTMGPAALYFGVAVVLTMLAVEWLDSRLFWDAYESGKHDAT